MTQLNNLDEHFMMKALMLATAAANEDEVPVGAIIVKEDKIIAEAYNKKEQTKLITSHAEILALEEACKKLKSWRLKGCTLFVTLEPCLMCAGAIYQTRIDRVVFGCRDPKGGALGSLYSIHGDTRLNHNFSVTEGILKTQCSEVLKMFFKSKRKKKNELPS